VTELVEWTSSSDEVATVSNDPVTRGLATGRAQGEATITASLPGSAVSGSARVTVTPAVLQSIAISAPATDLPKGVPVQLTATGTFSDGTSQDVTGFVTWAVSPAGIAQVSGGEGSAGVVTGLQEGSATVTATNGAVTSSITLRFTPARLLSLTVSATPSRGFTWAGTTTRFSAHGAFDDGSTLDLTRDVTWAVSPETVATFSSIPGKENQLWAFTGTTEQVTIAATEATSGLSDSFTWSRIRSRSR
jgi:uncharacterized protein YjdB